jgi:hypothetical protein
MQVKPVMRARESALGVMDGGEGAFVGTAFRGSNVFQSAVDRLNRRQAGGNDLPIPPQITVPIDYGSNDLHLFIAHRFRVVELGMKIPDDFSLIGSQHFNLRRLASYGPLRSLWPRRFNRWFPLPLLSFIATHPPLLHQMANLGGL